jgi:FHS family glucose/mannose:H+ symporter-like MFS transporter
MISQIRAHLALLVAGMVAFVLMGVGSAVYGPALPGMAERYTLTLGEAGWLISAHWIGNAVGIATMYFLAEKVPSGLALAIMAAGAAALALAPGWGATLAAAFVFGAGYGMVTAVFNPAMLVAFGARGTGMLSLLNAMYGIGAIAGPLIYVQLGQNAGTVFGGLAVICAAASVGTALTLKPGGKSTQSAPRIGFRVDPVILGFGALGVGLEACLVGLGPAALMAAGVTDVRAAELLSVFFAAFLGARILLIFTAHLIPSFWIYLFAAASALVFGLGAVFLSPGLFFVAMGVSASLYFPAFYVTATRAMGSDPRVPSVIIGAGLVGGISMPLMLAPLTQTEGLAFFYTVAVLGLILTLGSLISLPRYRA